MTSIPGRSSGPTGLWTSRLLVQRRPSSLLRHQIPTHHTAIGRFAKGASDHHRPMPPPLIDTSEFEAFEAVGWERQASGYDTLFSQITSRTVDPLLDAARVSSGTRLLDVATGPGLVAGKATARGATAVGIDIAEAMVAIARQRWPGAEFRRADAHDLPFPDDSFDAVTGNFALLHLGRPEHAVGEFVRVLVPGGRLAVTVWDEPGRVLVFDAVSEALDACGAAPPKDIPVGPAFSRFSADDEFRALLEGQRLCEVTVDTLAFTYDVRSVDQVWNGIVNGSVRTSALISRQPKATQEQIRDAFSEILERYRRDDVIELPTSVKLAAGRSPVAASV